MVVALLRMGVAALAMGLVVWFQPRRWPVLSPMQWLTLLACSALMLYVNQIFFAEGVSRTAAANAALIIALNPLLSSLLAALLLGERLSGMRLAGVALGFGGVAAVVLHRPGAGLVGVGPGDLLVLCSVTTWVLGGTLVQRLAGALDAVLISAWITIFGTLMLCAHMLLRPAPLLLPWDKLTGQVLLLVVLSGVLSTALGGLVWNRALMVLGVARTALYAYWVPIFGVLFAVLVLGEPLTVWHGVGLAAVLGGTWLGTRRR
jgi:drug/metabolite transporter (DMT)-like permease